MFFLQDRMKANLISLPLEIRFEVYDKLKLHELRVLRKVSRMLEDEVDEYLARLNTHVETFTYPWSDIEDDLLDRIFVPQLNFDTICQCREYNLTISYMRRNGEFYFHGEAMITSPLEDKIKGLIQFENGQLHGQMGIFRDYRRKKYLLLANFEEGKLIDCLNITTVNTLHKKYQDGLLVTARMVNHTLYDSLWSTSSLLPIQNPRVGYLINSLTIDGVSYRYMLFSIVEYQNTVVNLNIMMPGEEPMKKIKNYIVEKKIAYQIMLNGDIDTNILRHFIQGNHSHSTYHSVDFLSINYICS